MSQDLEKTALIGRETLLLHPSQMGNIKKEIFKTLHKKKQVWDDSLKGIITKFEKVQLLNGGRARIMDDSPYLQYQVRYTVHYLQPEVG